MVIFNSYVSLPEGKLCKLPVARSAEHLGFLCLRMAAETGFLANETAGGALRRKLHRSTGDK